MGAWAGKNRGRGNKGRGNTGRGNTGRDKLGQQGQGQGQGKGAAAWRHLQWGAATAERAHEFPQVGDILGRVHFPASAVAVNLSQ